MSSLPDAASPWRRTEAAIALLAWRDAQLAAVQARLEQALRSWQRAWGLQRCPADVECAAASGAPAGIEWRVLGTADAAVAWHGEPSEFDAALARALLDVECATTPVARNLLATCREQFLQALAGALALRREPSEAHAAPPAAGIWSGAVQATLPWGARVLMNAAAVQGLSRSDMPTAVASPTSALPPTPLVGLADALADSPLPLRVRLADCELDVGSLQDLRIGDVVRVRHALDAPLLVHDGEGQPVFAGFLARRGAFKALELASLPARAPRATPKVHP